MDPNYCELVSLRTSGWRPPLFCVGGGWLGRDENFQDMAAAMQVDHSVYQVRMANLDKTHLPLNVEQLAVNHLQRVREAQKHGPYQLLGYSFGGLVVYAMAVALVSAGEDVGLLALVDTPNPALFSCAGYSRLRKAYLANRMQKYLKNLSRGRIDYIASDVSTYVRSRVAPKIAHNLRQALRCPPSSMSKYQISKISDEMWNAYVPKEFRGPIVLFRAEDRKEIASDPSLGWRNSAQRVDVHFVTGDHVMMMRMPNVLTLLEKLTPYLADWNGERAFPTQPRGASLTTKLALTSASDTGMRRAW